MTMASEPNDETRRHITNDLRGVLDDLVHPAEEERVLRYNLAKVIANMRAEDNFKKWQDKVEGNKTWVEEFLNSVVIDPIKKHAQQALDDMEKYLPKEYAN